MKSLILVILTVFSFSFISTSQVSLGQNQGVEQYAQNRKKPKTVKVKSHNRKYKSGKVSRVKSHRRSKG